MQHSANLHLIPAATQLSQRRWSSWIVALMILMSLNQGLSAQESATQNPALAQGTGEDSVYRMGDLDTVNLFNGNLTLNLPLGTYEVGGDLAYGLSLNYNSTAPWEVERTQSATCQPTGNDNNVDFTIYHPSKLSNAGLGWQISMGRLIPPLLPRETQLYEQRWIS